MSTCLGCAGGSAWSNLARCKMSTFRDPVVRCEMSGQDVSGGVEP